MTMGRTDETTSTEVATIPERGIELLDRLGIRYTDTMDLQWRIAERTALANTLDELLAENGPLGLRDHLGEPFVIRNIDYLRSAFPANPVFAVIDAVTAAGEAVVYTTGALSVIIQLARGWQQGWWEGVPVKAEWSTKEPTADGNRPYKLVKA